MQETCVSTPLTSPFAVLERAGKGEGKKSPPVGGEGIVVVIVKAICFEVVLCEFLSSLGAWRVILSGFEVEQSKLNGR